MVLLGGGRSLEGEVHLYAWTPCMVVRGGALLVNEV